MQYINKDLGSFNLHMINTDRFKTITISVLFHTPIIKEEITKRNILSDILLQSSKNYESKRSLTIKAEELYACDISTNNQRIGNYIFTGFNLQVLTEIFLIIYMSVISEILQLQFTAYQSAQCKYRNSQYPPQKAVQRAYLSMKIHRLF